LLTPPRTHPDEDCTGFFGDVSLLTAYCVDPSRIELELNVEPIRLNIHARFHAA
jgi:hypothetical protein